MLALIDAKMTDHLALVVNAFTGIIVTDRTSAKNGDRANRQIEDVAVCGATATCNLDAPYTCYACGQFQPLLYADHRAVLERLERRREQTIATDKTTGVLWDRAILACRKVILDCEAMRRSSGSGRTEELPKRLILSRRTTLSILSQGANWLRRLSSRRLSNGPNRPYPKAFPIECTRVFAGKTTVGTRMASNPVASRRSDRPKPTQRRCRYPSRSLPKQWWCTEGCICRKRTSVIGFPP